MINIASYCNQMLNLFSGATKKLEKCLSLESEKVIPIPLQLIFYGLRFVKMILFAIVIHTDL